MQTISLSPIPFHSIPSHPNRFILMFHQAHEEQEPGANDFFFFPSSQNSRKSARNGKPARRRKTTSARPRKNVSAPPSVVLLPSTARLPIPPTLPPALATRRVCVRSFPLSATTRPVLRLPDHTLVERSRCISLAMVGRSTRTIRLRRISRVSKSTSSVCLSFLPPSITSSGGMSGSRDEEDVDFCFEQIRTLPTTTPRD